MSWCQDRIVFSGIPAASVGSEAHFVEVDSPSVVLCEANAAFWNGGFEYLGPLIVQDGVLASSCIYAGHQLATFVGTPSWCSDVCHQIGKYGGAVLNHVAGEPWNCGTLKRRS